MHQHPSPRCCRHAADAKYDSGTGWPSFFKPIGALLGGRGGERTQWRLKQRAWPAVLIAMAPCLSVHVPCLCALYPVHACLLCFADPEHVIEVPDNSIPFMVGLAGGGLAMETIHLLLQPTAPLKQAEGLKLPVHAQVCAAGWACRC